ncbi:bifunctional (p)ppGpp synthetase/guanosine-3',5'-bis(diphosphate) 3'-pyrophosphohydrolase [Salinisphaera sp. LB1]|uniref:RelA/SpoT family protein n=1 Tax=Salinisphaera sp. LB1 TaxID=2183911 RepID=UPI000D70656E|nr:bifunctional (p)ppGpp synthetase/guanosine-3',5'-bis(diphosphate) 3'-pyrophosphohydrolase [Salinisphaera sp. LB1]AWN14629.1 GTP pyrophosphokinase, (p)ppGpp synthetase II [Salinisphaera sp. LB1]
MELNGLTRIQSKIRTSRISREYGINALAEHLETYLPAEQIAQVRSAYEYGERQHRGQFRKTGEPYIYHPLAVARILANMRLDATTLMAAILHDVIEDTDAARDEVAQRFGAEVAALVDGVSKLDKAQFRSREQATAESFRKLMLAMTHDIRVILVKLADRLHNMRTLGGMSPKKRALIARETLEIYAPIARRLGINSMREELEEKGFANLYPRRYEVLLRASRSITGDRRSLLREIEENLSRAVAAEGLTAAVRGRRKNLYSIYRKMREKHRRFLDVFDLYGVRVIVNTVDECYRVLGIVHHRYRPISEQFNDYIANPKLNGYQSLHTTVLARGGLKFEVQIRTREMDQIAESGIAAHWQYKLGESVGKLGNLDTSAWLGHLAEMTEGERDSLAFVDNLRLDLFPDEVYVFTPKGQIIQLAKGSTCVDFAYAVHTELGNRCVAARVDGHLAPLNNKLKSGQTVEIITAKHARPNAAWLHFLRTGKARSGVRSYLKNQREDKARELGERLLEKSLSDLGLSLRRLSRSDIDRGLAEMGEASLPALYAAIGLGRRLAPLVARHFLASDAPVAAGKRAKPLAVQGTEGLVVEFAKCCHPVPGDAIHGQASVGRGLVVHRTGCAYSSRKGASNDRVELTWADNVSGDYDVELRVTASNERGLLANISSRIADGECSIENVNFPERGGALVTIRFLIGVRDRQHLASVIRRIRRIPQVEKVERS